MVQVLEQSDIFGKIGKSFGKGLGETVESETKRSLLKQDFAGLKEQMQGKDMSAMDLAGQLATMRGMKPETAMQFLPLLQNEMVRSQAAQRAQGGETPASGGVGGIPSDMPAQGAPVTPDATGESNRDKQFTDLFGVDPTSFSTPDAMKKFIGTLAPPKIDEIDRIRDQLVASGSAEFLDPATARERAKDIANQGFEEKKAVANKYLNELTNLSTYEDRFNKEISKRQIENIPGEYLDRLTQKYVPQIKNGVIAPDTAAKKAAFEANSLNKKITQIRTYGTPGLGTPSDEFVKGLNGLAKSFRDSGMQELAYDEMIASNDVGRRQAGAIAYGYSPELMKSIDDSKGFSNSWLYGEGTLPDRFNPRQIAKGKKVAKLSQQFSDKVIPAITSSDSIGAIGYAALQKGLDENVVYDDIRRLQESGEISLTDQQKSELENITPIAESLNDVWKAATGSMRGVKGRVSPWQKFKEVQGKR